MLVVHNDDETDTPGRIYRTVSKYLKELPAVLAGNAERFVFSDVDISMDNHYVHNQIIHPRPQMPLLITKTVIAADSKDEAVISGIPNGTTLRLNGKVVPEFEDNKLIIAADSPAKYHIHLSKWPYKDWAVEITAQ